jgi:hypothetical protein
MSLRRAWSLPILLVFVLQSGALYAQGQMPLSRPWAPANSALTVPVGRYEAALFGTSRYGLGDGLELGTQPLLFFLLPQAEIKFRFVELSGFAFAARGRLAYLTPFLQAISKSGALGLLPATTHPPQAVELDGDVLGSWLLAREHTASAWIGFAVAPHGSTDDLPLLDFPFLYPRFAPLHTTIVPRAGIALDGKLIGPLFYGVDLRAYLLPLEDVEGAFAIEQGLSLEYRPSSHVALEVAMRTSHARYPIGIRTHFLPLADLKIGF